MFWLAIRAILDTCTSVEHALIFIETLPMTGYFSLLLADKHDNAAIIEIADGESTTVCITGEDNEPFIYSVNHYRSPEMQQYNKLNCGIINNSKKREHVIKEWYNGMKHNLKQEDIHKLPATEQPEGLCHHFYNDGFGALWSMIFDRTKTLELTFVLYFYCIFCVSYEIVEIEAISVLENSTKN